MLLLSGDLPTFRCVSDRDGAGLGAGCAGKVERKQVAALFEHRRIRRIEVFRQRVVHDSAAERDHIARDVNDREHDAVAKIVKRRAGLSASAAEKTRRHFGIGIAELAQAVGQRGKAVRRIAEPEVLDRGGAQRAFLKVCPRLGADLRVKQALAEEPRRLLVHIQHPRAVKTVAPPRGIRGDRDADALGKELKRGYIFEIFDLPHKGDHIPACAAAEAVIALPRGEHREGRRFLRVERAQSEHIRAGTLQTDVGGDQIHNVIARLDLFNDALVDHICLPLQTCGMNSSV